MINVVIVILYQTIKRDANLISFQLVEQEITGIQAASGSYANYYHFTNSIDSYWVIYYIFRNICYKNTMQRDIFIEYKKM